MANSADQPATTRGSAPAPLWTLAEVAAYLRVSQATVRRWTNAGQLACYRLGGNRERRFTREAILAFVKKDEQLIRVMER
jgi:excisionase family DNA binding protein